MAALVGVSAAGYVSLAMLFVVPIELQDGVTKFATLGGAMSAGSLAAGDTIQIEPGS